jgi:hypothetical protein
METIKETCIDYLEKTLPQANCSFAQRNDTRNAFYAGSLCAMDLFIKLSELEEEKAVVAFEKIRKDIYNFFEQNPTQRFQQEDTIIVDKLISELGYEGIALFTMFQDDYGEITPVINVKGDGNISYPHSVHFNEGMQVRNTLREFEECKGWSDHDFDDKYVNLIDLAIKKCENKSGWICGK